MKNWIVAAVAIGLGGAVSAALLIFANPARSEVDVFAVARDLPAGAAITRDSLRLEAIVPADGISSFFTRGDESLLGAMRAGHDLAAGQLLQRADVLAATAAPDDRLVFVPVKNAPPAAPGSRVDLLLVTGTLDRPAVVPFALGIEVRAVVTGGFIVVVSSKQAAAFVYAAEAMHLDAVVAAPGTAGGSESPVDAPEQALAAAAQQ